MPGSIGNRKNGGARGSVGLERPSQATGLGAQRMNDTARAADENLAIDDGWLRERGHIPVEPECPLQLQATHLVEAQSGRFRRLVTSVVRAGAPAVPGRFRTVGDGDPAIGA